MLTRWAIKLSIAGVLYIVMTHGVKLPDTILGYKMPAAVQQWVDSNTDVGALGQQTDAGFKGIANALK
jgi:hypothetical protein